MHAWWSELRSRALLRRSEPAPGTVEVLHAVAGGSSFGPRNSGRFFRGVRRGRTPRTKLPAVSRAHSDPRSCDRVQLISAVWDLTAPVKIYIIIIVHMCRNEHEFSCVKSLCGARAQAAQWDCPGCTESSAGLKSIKNHVHPL